MSEAGSDADVLDGAEVPSDLEGRVVTRRESLADLLNELLWIEKFAEDIALQEVSETATEQVGEVEGMREVTDLLFRVKISGSNHFHEFLSVAREEGIELDIERIESTALEQFQAMEIVSLKDGLEKLVDAQQKASIYFEKLAEVVEASSLEGVDTERLAGALRENAGVERNHSKLVKEALKNPAISMEEGTV